MSDCLVLNGNYQPLSLLPLSVISWQSAIKLYYLNRVKVVEEYDEWLVHSPSMEFNVPAVVALNDYFPVKKNIRFTRANMYLRDMYQCQYCADTFSPKELTIDHILPISKGGKTNWENCTTACTTCNVKKGNKTNIKPITRPYKPDYYNLSSLRRKMPFTIKHPKWLEYIGCLLYTSPSPRD